MDRQMDRLFLSVAIEAQDIYRKEFKRIDEKIKRLKIVTGRKKKDIAKIIFPPGPLKKLWFEILIKTYAQNAEIAGKDIKEHLKADRFSEWNYAAAGTTVGIDLSDYKDVYFNDTVFMARAKEYADTAFEFAGKQAGMITDELRATVHTAIDNQWTEKQFSDAMKSFQLRYTGDVADEAKQLNSRFRTGMNKALNDARMDIYQDEVACVALQYSAVLDEMTTQICIELDGTVWLKKNHEWEFYLPPNHFGCRSTIVPIFNDDDYKLTSADRKFPEPAEGFGGRAGAVVKPAGKPVPHPGYKTT